MPLTCPDAGGHRAASLSGGRHASGLGCHAAFTCPEVAVPPEAIVPFTCPEVVVPPEAILPIAVYLSGGRRASGGYHADCRLPVRRPSGLWRPSCRLHVWRPSGRFVTCPEAVGPLEAVVPPTCREAVVPLVPPPSCPEAAVSPSWKLGVSTHFSTPLKWYAS